MINRSDLPFRVTGWTVSLRVKNRRVRAGSPKAASSFAQDRGRQINPSDPGPCSGHGSWAPAAGEAGCCLFVGRGVSFVFCFALSVQIFYFVFGSVEALK